ncbi:hypothetical protein [Pontibacter diazotrophicus]|uniref:hypothetical protein n=1 Tax=Pontibacter diazotrophicus TaxID=1400979 RepID=UPI001C696277|nr:hypothetical protein [Pontibacter diazotrophicus]
MDTVDPNPEYIPEDLSFNDQESVVEILLEKVLGFENAIAEYDDHDTEERTKKKTTKIDFIVQDSPQQPHPDKTFNLSKQRYPNFEDSLPKGYHQLSIPPPKI